MRLRKLLLMFTVLAKCFTQTVVFFTFKVICITLNCSVIHTFTLHQTLHIQCIEQNLETNRFHALCYTHFFKYDYIMIHSLYRHTFLFINHTVLLLLSFSLCYCCNHFHSCISKLINTTDNILYTHLVMTYCSIYYIING